MKEVYSRLCVNVRTNGHERKKQYEHSAQNKERENCQWLIFLFCYMPGGKDRRRQKRQAATKGLKGTFSLLS
ncbi:MAG: hypothetical protein EOM65_00980 [Synergistales bacterium]|uniref:hypothetical protein n=1 Tax=Aminivibrio sp. TaxID=1872489 RepID=UPI002B1ECE3F|nr:hypothetical protein [Aminivibrio sp.]MEA4952707.1 hypothetical protein [Aminivibrio sp.]NCB14737.1 hypothetical protein [Synergistales bacterium]